MRNTPKTASVNIKKHIDILNAEAWGNPTFIFKIKLTGYYDYTTGLMNDIASSDQPTWIKTVTITEAVAGVPVDNATGLFGVEPGKYEITEVKVARYAADGYSVDDLTDPAGAVTDISFGEYKALFSIAPGGEALVTFSNKLDNYEKQSHSALRVNEFNGYKALGLNDRYIRISDLSPVSVGSSTYTVTVQKSALSPALVKADGTETPLGSEQYADLVISASDTEITVTDQGDSITVTGRIEDLLGSIYTLSADYGGFSTAFELRFEADATGRRIKTEKRVIFLTDENNRSYYGSDAEKNSVYTLIVFEYAEGDPKILVNGEIRAASPTLIPTLTVDAEYSDYEFDTWSYTVAAESDPGTQSAPVDASDSELYSVITGASDENLIITVTPKLKAKTTPSP